MSRMPIFEQWQYRIWYQPDDLPPQPQETVHIPPADNTALHRSRRAFGKLFRTALRPQGLYDCLAKSRG